MSATVAVAPDAAVAAVNPLIATDLRPEALIARVAKAWEQRGKADIKSQHLTMNAFALYFLNAADLNQRDVAARGAAWKVLMESLRENANEQGFNSAAPLRSCLKRIVLLDVDGKYLKPWAKGDFTVPMLEAYKALGAAGARPVAGIEKKLRQTQKWIAKHYPQYTAVVTMDPDTARLVVTF